MAWLFLWMTAQTACIHHCASSSVSLGQESGCCAKKHCAASEESGERELVKCGSLKSMIRQVTGGVLPLHDRTAWAPSVILALARWESNPGTPIPGVLRAAPRMSWAFVPETCLGAAFRTLAPPAI